MPLAKTGYFADVGKKTQFAGNRVHYPTNSTDKQKIRKVYDCKDRRHKTARI